MQIVLGTLDHLDSWAELRAALWPRYSVEYHRSELSRAFLSGTGQAAGFVTQLDSGEVVGFAEASLRRDYVNGCRSSPVLFLEGIYVRPDHRRKGLARLLCNSIATWGQSAGCVEFASDALIENVESHAFHRGLGFSETERVVFFRKLL